MVPSYWNREQTALLEDQTRQTGYRSLGTIKRGLALAGLSPGITIDVDSYAVSISHTRVQSRTAACNWSRRRCLPILLCLSGANASLPRWQADALRDSRRDPRAHAETDQQLHDQILDKLYDWASHQSARIELKHQDWQSDVLVPVDEVLAVFRPPGPTAGPVM